MNRINVALLSRLVTWAAEDFVRGTDPTRAVELGIAKEGDPRLGRWNQASWSEAERNGFCKTAFCVAGGAVALDENSVIVMEHSVVKDNGNSLYDGSYVIDKEDVPEGADTKFGYLWLPEDQTAYDFLVANGLVRGPYAVAPSIAARGQELLGLTDGEAQRLFDGSNGIEDVVTTAFAIAREDDQTLDVPEWVREEFDSAIYA